jgi:signal transduction histidine kinase
VEDLLDVSRIAADQFDLQLEEVDLVEVVRAVVARRAPGRADVTLHAEGPVIGRWDRRRLTQIVEHLVGNAIKYGQERPIDVEARIEGDQAQLVVRDQGIGIDVDEQERIFERFARAASARHYDGLGLGLWVAKQIAEKLGGSIAVTSAPGDGAVFIVTLPRTPR